MVEAYWQIGKLIVEEQSGEERAEYSAGLIRELSVNLGKGFKVSMEYKTVRKTDSLKFSTIYIDGFTI